MRHSAEGISPVPEQWLRVGFSGAGPKECLLFANFTVSPICAAEALIDPVTERNKSDGSRESLGPPREPAMRREIRIASRTAQALAATPRSRKPIGLRVTMS